MPDPMIHLLQALNLARCDTSTAAGCIPAADQFFEGDVVQNAADRAVHVGPDRLELADILFAHSSAKFPESDRELDEWSAHRTDHVSNRDLARRPGQDIAAFRSTAAADDIDPL